MKRPPLAVARSATFPLSPYTKALQMGFTVRTAGVGPGLGTVWLTHLSSRDVREPDPTWKPGANGEFMKTLTEQWREEQAEQEREQFRRRILQNPNLDDSTRARLLAGGPELWRDEGWTNQILGHLAKRDPSVLPPRVPRQSPPIGPIEPTLEPESISSDRPQPLTLKPRYSEPPYDSAREIQERTLKYFQERYQGRTLKDLEGSRHYLNAYRFWIQCYQRALHEVYR